MNNIKKESLLIDELLQDIDKPIIKQKDKILRVKITKDHKRKLKLEKEKLKDPEYKRKFKLEKKNNSMLNTHNENKNELDTRNENKNELDTLNKNKNELETLNKNELDTRNENKNELVTQDTKTKNELLKIANEMYKKLKDHVKENNDFIELEDKKKLEYFRDTLNYKDFMTEFPIVTRYMICMGQYSSKAYTRLLEKIQRTIHPPPEKREKGYMEDQWVRRQADYIRYLWEAYQKGHYNTVEAKWIWEDAYKKLKGEFDDFRDKYKSIETNTKKEKEQLKISNTKELFDRLKSGMQHLDDNDEKKIINALKEKVYKRRFINTMQELLKVKKPIAAICQGQGRGENEVKEDKEKPKIIMVEHLADPTRINEVPEHLRLDESLAKKLPGFNDHLETVYEN